MVGGIAGRTAAREQAADDAVGVRGRQHGHRTAVRRRDHRGARHRRRPVGPRRPDEARRTGARRRRHGLPGHRDHLAAHRRHLRPRPASRACCSPSSSCWSASTPSTSSTASTDWPPGSWRWRRAPSSRTPTCSPSSSASSGPRWPRWCRSLLVGVCLGFLPNNFFPARIFMGDTGSMTLGLLLAAEHDHAVRAGRPERDGRRHAVPDPAARCCCPVAVHGGAR